MSFIQLQDQTACNSEKGAVNCKGYGNVTDLCGIWFRILALGWSVELSKGVRLFDHSCDCEKGIVNSERAGNFTDIPRTQVCVLVLIWTVESSDDICLKITLYNSTRVRLILKVPGVLLSSLTHNFLFECLVDQCRHRMSFVWRPLSIVRWCGWFWRLRECYRSLWKSIVCSSTLLVSREGYFRMSIA